VSPLLQPLLNRPDWHQGAVIGLVVVAAPTVTTWAGVADFTTPASQGFPSRLTLAWEY
jgi:hypothetical protein